MSRVSVGGTEAPVGLAYKLLGKTADRAVASSHPSLAVFIFEYQNNTNVPSLLENNFSSLRISNSV